MTSMLKVRQAIIDRIKFGPNPPDVTWYWYVPDQVEAPAVMVMPDFPFADMEQTFSSSYTNWGFMLTLVADRVNDEAAQELLSTWIDPDGPFVSILRSDDIVDDLSRLSHDVRVTTGGDFNEVTFDRTKYWYAQLRVKIRA